MGLVAVTTQSHHPRLIHNQNLAMSILLPEHAIVKREREDSRKRQELFVTVKPDKVSWPDVLQTERVPNRMLDPAQIARPNSDLVVQLNLFAFSMSIGCINRPFPPLTQRKSHRITRRTEMLIEDQAILDLFHVTLIIRVRGDVICTLIFDILWCTDLVRRDSRMVEHLLRQNLCS